MCASGEDPYLSSSPKYRCDDERSVRTRAVPIVQGWHQPCGPGPLLWLLRTRGSVTHCRVSQCHHTETPGPHGRFGRYCQHDRLPNERDVCRVLVSPNSRRLVRPSKRECTVVSRLQLRHCPRFPHGPRGRGGTTTPGRATSQ